MIFGQYVLKTLGSVTFYYPFEISVQLTMLIIIRCSIYVCMYVQLLSPSLLPLFFFLIKKLLLLPYSRASESIPGFHEQLLLSSVLITNFNNIYMLHGILMI